MTTYSSDLYGRHAIASLTDHDPSTPYFLYLPWYASTAFYLSLPG
jgi:hypothetical protein